MSDKRDNHVITQDALEYYIKKLEDLKNDENDILVGKSIIIQDVDSNTKLSKKALSFIKSKSDNVFKDYVTIICSALKMYLKGLEQSKTDIEKRLDSDIHFQWEVMNEEITDVKDLQKSLDCNHKKKV